MKAINRNRNGTGEKGEMRGQRTQERHSGENRRKLPITLELDRIKHNVENRMKTTCAQLDGNQVEAPSRKPGGGGMVDGRQQTEQVVRGRENVAKDASQKE